MKHKKLFRSVTALLAALVLMGGFSVTAFAGGGDVSDEPPTPVTETEPEETTGGYEPQPLTPEGNMSLVDDITGGAILKKWTAKSERWYNNKKRRETHGKHQVYRGIQAKHSKLV